jgi:hypothetical protein
LERQARLLHSYGVDMGLTRVADSLTIRLYALFNFYVEAFFEKNSSLPIYLRAFNDMIQLDVYLKELDISELLLEKDL